jgi:DNA-binding GntR family transcriptional regulator
VSDIDPRDLIDHESGRPVYMQIADLVAAQIETGKLAVDRPIPAENRLAAEPCGSCATVAWCTPCQARARS